MISQKDFTLKLAVAESIVKVLAVTGLLILAACGGGGELKRR